MSGAARRWTNAIASSRCWGVCRRVAITHRVQVCRDPCDDKFLHVALNGEAEAIVTGDADLLALHPFHGVQILSPAAFLGLIA